MVPAAIKPSKSARARKELRDMMKNGFTLECSGLSEKERGWCNKVEFERGVK
jgi:hypothetical protein